VIVAGPAEDRDWSPLKSNGTICSEAKASLRQRISKDIRMTRWQRSILVSLFVVWLGMASACNKSENNKGKANNPNPPGAIGPGQIQASGPLTAGDKAPPLEAPGWLNGPCPVLGANGPKVIVVDIWAMW
jgi:hypothetical protein